MRKFALINGASGGIGSAIAQCLSEDFNLILLGRDLHELNKLKQDIQSNYSDSIILIHPIEVTNLSTFDKIFSIVKENEYVIGSIVNAVGIVPVGGIMDVSESEWEITFQTSFMSAVRTIRYFSPLMNEQGGSIVIVNGRLALQPEPNLVISSSITGALRNFSKAISRDLIQYGIRVNSVLPGATETKLLNNIALQINEKSPIDPEILLRDMAEANPMKKLADPMDVANAVAFLCSEKAAHINGAFISIDGGSGVTA